MRDFVEYVVTALTEHPGDVEICEVTGEKMSILELRCHREDLGRVIGKNGNTIGAVRSLLSVLAARQGRKAVLEVVE